MQSQPFNPIQHITPVPTAIPTQLPANLPSTVQAYQAPHNAIFGIPVPSPHDLVNPTFLTWLAIAIGIMALLGFIFWAADQLLAPISAMQHGMVGIVGKRGSGKSFTAVTYARRWRMFNPHKPVYTNLEKLELPGDGPVYLNCTHEQITKAYDGLLLIDEAGVWLNAWNFVDRDQRKVARWIAATRHYKVMVILTAHAASHINVRVRSVVDEWIKMTPFTTLKLFRGKYYESETSIDRPKQESHTVWIPMWRSVCKSYNTDSLHKQAMSAGVDMVGTDAELPGMIGVGNRGAEALRPESATPPNANGYTAGTPTTAALDTLLAEIENDPSKLVKQGSSKKATVKETTTVMTIDPAAQTVEDVVQITTGANAQPDTSALEEWEVWVSQNATDADLAMVRRMQTWFQNNGGNIYEIELPNVGAYKIRDRNTRLDNATEGAVYIPTNAQPPNGHYDSRSFLQKILRQKVTA